MSVAIGTAQPSRFSGWPATRLMPTKIGGRHDHPADGGGDREGGTRRVAQIAGDELALEFQPDDEEEDRQQSVGGPLRERQPQMQRLGAEGELRDARGRRAPTGSSPTPAPRLPRPAAAPRRRSPGAAPRRDAAPPARMPRLSRRGRMVMTSLAILDVRSSRMRLPKTVCTARVVRREVWSAVAPRRDYATAPGYWMAGEVGLTATAQESCLGPETPTSPRKLMSYAVAGRSGIGVGARSSSRRCLFIWALIIAAHQLHVEPVGVVALRYYYAI